jgi:hypothetical protein
MAIYTSLLLNVIISLAKLLPNLGTLLISKDRKPEAISFCQVG